LIDILRNTALACPDAPALDDGRVSLSYRRLIREVAAEAAELRALGIGRGDRVGIRLPSGSNELYVSILAVLAVGAAYVPVDADDPEERAELVFGEAEVNATIGDSILVGATPGSRTGEPTLDDDAWIIFTSGSTGKPKGVAVTHRNAAAFVDAEAALFLQDQPIGPGDRVLAGLSVAFDASCEEMWLAWRYGACLVPAPRSLVRTGMDLGPWLAEKGVTVVSTVPTLAALWPAEALSGVRLLIFGGEACPPELAARLAEPGREVWNTYGPTEATVVACAARLGGDDIVRIGLPLNGWDLAVVNGAGEPVELGEIGELVIGGVGLARYLDPVKDAEKYAPLESLGWQRAYRSGDLVRADWEGLVFVGRGDEQIKLGGRRIELGEIDAALLALPGVVGAAAAVRGEVLVGYLVVGEEFDQSDARKRLRKELPAALVPRLAIVEDLPTRTSGKVDRNALPWPLPGQSTPQLDLSPIENWLAECWTEVLGLTPSSRDADFFDSGGSSLSAAKLVSALRTRYPAMTVAELYEYPSLAGLAELLPGTGMKTTERIVTRVSRGTAIVQALLMIPLMTAGAMRWVVSLAALNNVIQAPWAPTLSWWWVLAGALLFITPVGRMGLSVAAARLLLRGLEPGDYPRGGSVHLRLWAVEQFAARVGAAELSSAPWLSMYARALGAKVGRDADLHSLPPMTGLLRLGDGAAVEPEVDLAGYWLDGDVLKIGDIRIGAGARVGVRSTLLPGAHIGDYAQISPGSAVAGDVPAGQQWAGVPAEAKTANRRRQAPGSPPRTRRWAAVYGATAIGLSLLPIAAITAGIAVLGEFVQGSSLGEVAPWLFLGIPLVTVTVMAVFALATWVFVRLLAVGLVPGQHPVHSRVSWQAWTTVRLMGMARVWLFPLYASTWTPVWLRALGMKIGKGTELSTVLALPSMTSVADGAFLADDTMVAPYELHGGWMRVARARIGKRAFLGNSGMTAPGRKVPKGGLVGVLSSTPEHAEKGTSYLGMPPVELRRQTDKTDSSRTYDPPVQLKLARAAVELCRLIPAMGTAALALAAALTINWIAAHAGFGIAFLTSGLVLIAAGIIAAATATAAKWLLVGRIKPGNRPLWSSFVWRNELADNFIEVLAAPWFAEPWLGTAPLNLWLRSLGSKIGAGVWCETYWLPEADLITLGRGVTVNRGCVLQTHLFHDRVLSMDTVVLQDGATLGPNGVVLPAASLGENTTVGPASLVLRGEAVPGQTRWFGNPIVAWPAAR
jgi:non-ribosomal peptide synthetase-like protein